MNDKERVREQMDALMKAGWERLPNGLLRDPFRPNTSMDIRSAYYTHLRYVEASDYLSQFFPKET